MSRKVKLLTVDPDSVRAFYDPDGKSRTLAAPCIRTGYFISPEDASLMVVMEFAPGMGYFHGLDRVDLAQTIALMQRVLDQLGPIAEPEVREARDG